MSCKIYPRGKGLTAQQHWAANDDGISPEIVFILKKKIYIYIFCEYFNIYVRNI